MLEYLTEDHCAKCKNNKPIEQINSLFSTSSLNLQMATQFFPAMAMTAPPEIRISFKTYIENAFKIFMFTIILQYTLVTYIHIKRRIKLLLLPIKFEFK